MALLIAGAVAGLGSSLMGSRRQKKAIERRQERLRLEREQSMQRIEGDRTVTMGRIEAQTERLKAQRDFGNQMGKLAGLQTALQRRQGQRGPGGRRTRVTGGDLMAQNVALWAANEQQRMQREQSLSAAVGQQLLAEGQQRQQFMSAEVGARQAYGQRADALMQEAAAIPSGMELALGAFSQATSSMDFGGGPQFGSMGEMTSQMSAMRGQLPKSMRADFGVGDFVNLQQLFPNEKANSWWAGGSMDAIKGWFN